MDYNIFISKDEKRVYVSPQIEQIKLDNEISLIMNSAASTPEGDPESY